MQSILAHHNARLCIAGQCLSTLGDSALWLAMGIWVKAMTGSTSKVSICFLAYALGTLLSPIGGMLTDRISHRRLLIITNLASAALVLCLLFVHNHDQVWLVHFVMFCYGLAAAVLAPAQTALFQRAVPDELLGDANSLMQTVQQGLRLIAPLLGATLFSWFGPRPVIIGDAATFIADAATILALRMGDRLHPNPAPKNWMIEIAAGVSHICNTAVLRQVTVAAGAAIMSFSLSQTILFEVMSKGLHRPDSTLGVIVSVQGIGAIVAGAVAPATIRRLSEGRLAALGLAAGSIGFFLHIIPLMPIVLLGAVLVGASSAWISIGTTTLYQRNTPPELIGRADAALGFFFCSPQTIALAAGAALVTVVDYRVLLIVMAALSAGGATYLFTKHEQRTCKYHDKLRKDGLT